MPSAKTWMCTMKFRVHRTSAHKLLPSEKPYYFTRNDELNIKLDNKDGMSICKPDPTVWKASGS